MDLINHDSILPGSSPLRAAICDKQRLNTSASPFIPSYHSSVVTIRSDDGTELKKDGLLLRGSPPPTAAVCGGQSLSTSASPFVPGSRLLKDTIKNKDGVELTPEILKKHSLAPPILPGRSADSHPTRVESEESKNKHLHEQKLKSWPEKESERTQQEAGNKHQLIKEADERQRIQREQDITQQQLNEQKKLIQAWLQETKDQHGQDLENARISELPNKVLSPSPSMPMEHNLNATADEAETSSEAGKKHPVIVPRTHSPDKSQDGAECALGSLNNHDRGFSRSSDAVEEMSVDALTKARLLERRQQKQDRIKSLLSMLAQQTLP
ncbi:hypothetical protein SERLA73DRAFT_190563 [Serpula lacrymans var. lacrymans S7.3]|uniref:Uncharacterized protein n=2 Tax=Serpula lacrymans var. lacrymans TaxID=341189 RepID=F8QFY0_SERL3|nr:uncharacterized protein SERLADRAFT_463410 [Serpula lacrymans var. lacrymans S7.9]EGN92728.1 hypothetical protein SERLA73DRAFT_190563 [Serpula lacrymans var. lacrymans S7.3]EGO26389.1 hypothetical protein SERLADRAFT_463410 [Serpula lacrymans var. lacrymans S7.9]